MPLQVRWAPQHAEKPKRKRQASTSPVKAYTSRFAVEPAVLPSVSTPEQPAVYPGLHSSNLMSPGRLDTTASPLPLSCPPATTGWFSSNYGHVPPSTPRTPVGSAAAFCSPSQAHTPVPPLAQPSTPVTNTAAPASPWYPMHHTSSTRKRKHDENETPSSLPRQPVSQKRKYHKTSEKCAHYRKVHDEVAGLSRSSWGDSEEVDAVKSLAYSFELVVMRAVPQLFSDDVPAEFMSLTSTEYKRCSIHRDLDVSQPLDGHSITGSSREENKECEEEEEEDSIFILSIFTSSEDQAPSLARVHPKLSPSAPVLSRRPALHRYPLTKLPFQVALHVSGRDLRTAGDNPWPTGVVGISRVNAVLLREPEVMRHAAGASAGRKPGRESHDSGVGGFEPEGSP